MQQSLRCGECSSHSSGMDRKADPRDRGTDPSMQLKTSVVPCPWIQPTADSTDQTVQYLVCILWTYTVQTCVVQGSTEIRVRPTEARPWSKAISILN